MILDQAKISRITDILKDHPQGMSITEIARALRMNRNSLAKYLDLLQMSGQVEMQEYGTARVYFISRRTPIMGMLQYLSDLVAVIDKDLRIMQANDGFIHLVGKNRDDVIGARIDNLGATWLEGIIEAPGKRGGLKIREGITEFTTGSGDAQRSYKMKVIPVVLEDGNRGIAVLLEDITGERAQRDALRLSEDRYRGIVEDQTDYVTRFNPDFTVTYMNTAMQRAIFPDGEKKSPLSFRHCIVAGDLYLLDRLFPVQKRAPVVNLESRIMTYDGGTRWIHWSIRPSFDHDGALIEFQAVGRDITEKKEAESRIRDQVRQFEFLSKGAREYLEAPEEIYALICRHLEILIPGLIHVVVCTIDHQAKQVIARATGGMLTSEYMVEHFGTDILGQSFPLYDPIIDQISKRKIVRINERFFEGFHDKILQTIPKESLKQAFQDFGVSQIYVAGLVSKGNTVGFIFFSTSDAYKQTSQELFRAYINQAAIAVENALIRENLRRTEGRMFEMADFAPFPMALIDPSGSYLFINRKFTEVFGYGRDDIRRGSDWFRLAFPNYQARNDAIQWWKSDLAGSQIGEIRPRTMDVRCKDGAVKKTEFIPVTLSDGNEFVVYRDVTEDEEIDRIQQFLTAIVDSTDDAIIGKTVDGVILSWNPAAERIYGFTAAEMIGRHVSSIVPARLLKELTMILEKIRKGQHIENFETERRRKDGHIITVSVTISPIRDRNGMIIGASSIFRDITNRKREERIAASHEHYRNLIESINVGFYRSTGDREGRFIWGNSALVRIFGYETFQELKEVPIEEFFAEPEGRSQLLKILKANGAVKNREIALIRRDGSVIWVAVSAVAGFRKSGEIDHITGIAVDITEWKHLEERFAAVERELLATIGFIQDPTYLIDRSRQVIAWNNAMETFTGAKADEVRGSSQYRELLDFIHRGMPPLIDLLFMDDELRATTYPEVQRIGESLVWRTSITQLTTGQEVLIIGRARSFTDAGGNFIGAIESYRETSGGISLPDPRAHGIQGDLTLGDERLARLIRSHAQITGEITTFRDLLLFLARSAHALDAAGDAAVIMDFNGRIDQINRRMATVLGIESDDAVIGKNFVTLTAPEYRRILLEALQEARRMGVSSVRLSLITPQGRIPFGASFAQVSTEEGILPCVIGIFREDSLNTSPRP